MGGRYLLQDGSCALLNEASDIRGLRQPGVPGPSLHHHVGVHLEQEEPQCSHELLWAPELPGPFPSLGSDGILPPAGQLHHRGPSGYQSVAVLVEHFSFLHDVIMKRLCFPGIVVGHVYFFLEDVFPNQPGGGRWLKTPLIM